MTSSRISKIYDIELRRYSDEKIKVCDEDVPYLKIS